MRHLYHCLILFSVTAYLCSPTWADLAVVSPSAYHDDINVLNANLGIPSGLTTEGFDDGLFEPGLTITAGPGSSFTNEVGSSGNWTADTRGFWQATVGNTLTFSFAEAPSYVGIGLASLNGVFNTVSVNGDAARTLNHANFGDLIFGNGRNGYLVITREEGISSVVFTKGRGGESRLQFDHIVFGNPIPEPGFASFALFAMGCTIGRRNRKARV